jgi:GT2 family glycosyltransferase
MNKKLKMQDNVMLSIIIITWNSEVYIEECVDSLLKELRSYNITFEIIVVDNGSTDKTIQILNDLGAKYEYIKVNRLGRNTGTTFSRNLAIKESKGEYLFFIDSDEVAFPGAIKALLNTFEKDKRVGIVAPRVVLKDGSIQFSVRKFPTAFTKFFKISRIKKLKELAEKDELYPANIYSFEFKDLLDVDVAAACGWMVSRVAVDEIGLLDERIFYSPEDVDYCVRMWLDGWKVVYNPSSQLLHYSQKLTYKSFKFLFLHTLGLIYYFCKYRYLFDRNKLYRKIKR